MSVIKIIMVAGIFLKNLFGEILTDVDFITQFVDLFTLVCP